MRRVQKWCRASAFFGAPLDVAPPIGDQAFAARLAPATAGRRRDPRTRLIGDVCLWRPTQAELNGVKWANPGHRQRVQPWGIDTADDHSQGAVADVQGGNPNGRTRTRERDGGR